MGFKKFPPLGLLYQLIGSKFWTLNLNQMGLQTLDPTRKVEESASVSTSIEIQIRHLSLSFSIFKFNFLEWLKIHLKKR